MTCPTCRYYGSCDAPLCPDDEQSISCGIWYPDEEICRRSKQRRENWLKQQRKLARLLSSLGAEAGFWTIEMLSRGSRVTKATRGLDPDQELEAQVAKWLSTRAGLRQGRRMTEEERARAAERLRAFRRRQSEIKGLSAKGL